MPSGNRFIVSRATRGADGHRSQPQKRFRFNVRARVRDGNALARGETIGNEAQGYLGPVIRDKIPYIATTSRADFLSAFNKRVNNVPRGQIAPWLRGRSRQLIKELVPVPHTKFEWDTELFQSWNSQFDSEKQVRMVKAYDLLGSHTLRDYSSKELFTKIEALVKDHEKVAPRIIFKGSDVYNCISGPIFTELMVRLKSSESNLTSAKVMFAYKQHTPEIASFLDSEFSPGSCIEADFSSNDSTQVADVLDLEIALMRRLGCPKWFLRLHRVASRSYSVYNTKYGVSAVAEHQLATGATDTTFRNSFWNLCIFYSWVKKYRVDTPRVVILGDDMLAVLRKRVRRGAYHYEKVAAEACMVAKATMSPRLSKCHFLSKHFVPSSATDGHVMLPMMGKVLAKFNCRPNANLGVSDDEYMAGKALSHAYEFRHCHALRNLFVKRANRHLTASGGVYSLEGVTYHVRVFSLHKGMIDSFLSGSMFHEDLVRPDDLTHFWDMLAGLTFVDIYPLAESIILGDGYAVLEDYVATQLVDY
jgi:hypothetical protein